MPDMSGAVLDASAYYEVSAPPDPDEFIRALRELLPAGSVLYFEGTAIAPDVVVTFEAYAAAPLLKIARGTIAPTPRCFHVAAHDGALERISKLFESHAQPEICDHFHAYCNKSILLQWHDAFYDDPLLLAGVLPESSVDHFCRSIGCSYERRSSRMVGGTS